MRMAFSEAPRKCLILRVCFTQRKNSSICPAALVEIGDLLGAGVEIVGENAQDFAGFDAHAYFANGILHRVLAVRGLARRQIADRDRTGWCDPRRWAGLVDRVKRRVGLEPRHDAASGLIELGPPAVIVIAKVEHIGGARPRSASPWPAVMSLTLAAVTAAYERGNSASAS